VVNSLNELCDLPGILRIVKYKWLTFYLFFKIIDLSFFFCISIFNLGRVPASIGWRTSIGSRYIVWETDDLEIYDREVKRICSTVEHHY